MAAAKITVRMYNVGFGDCFLVTVKRGRATWRMLVDCGVHSQGVVEVGGKKRPIGETVATIIRDLGASPKLDVVVATHHHADHISGFADDAWTQVTVGEVWVPFVEDEKDKDAKKLKQKLAVAAEKIHAYAQFVGGANRGGWKPEVALADLFAVNSSGNAVATDRLLSRNGRQFANTPAVRYLPSKDAAKNLIETTVEGATVHILGPSRDPADLKRMDPPSSGAWLRFAEDDPGALRIPAIFGDTFSVPGAEADSLPHELTQTLRSLRLEQLVNDERELLAAASILERSVNNTSIYFVLEVDDKRLLFVGDSQQGAWDHVLDDEASRELVSNVDFYKIGHHGSHNATPKRFVKEVLGDGAWAMLPWGLVKRWPDIPKTELLDALAATHTKLVRADAPVKGPHVKVDPDLRFSEISL